MADGWSRERAGSHGGYADWEGLIRTPPPEGASLFLPVFVRIEPDAAGAHGPAIVALLEDEATPTLIEVHERAWLATVLARERAGTPLRTEIRSVLYRPPEAVDDPRYTVLHVSPAVELRLPADFRESRPSAAQVQPLTLPPDGARLGRPAVAAIDDGIPYLNARFRRSPAETRFEAVWLQSREDVAERDRGAGALTELFAGRVLERADIDGMIGEGDEGAVYARQNAQLFPPNNLRGTDLSATHGGHVLDLAAGDRVGGALAQVPLLAVQLPPHGIKDTSGRLLDGYVVQGLRWVVDRALALGALRGDRVPLIVNLSIGTVAGPKNGHGFVEDWLRHEIERYRALSPDTPIRLVLAYGNSCRGRQVALAELEAGAERALEWRLPPDDWTSSYLELRADGAAALSIRPPGGPASPGCWPAPGERLTLRAGGQTLAAVYGQPDGSAMVAVRANHSPTGGPVAPAGEWRVVLGSEAGARVGLQVQRDETPGGYRQAGRQSWLEVPGTDGWDPETADWTGTEGTAIRRDGTHTSYAGPAAVGICRVGASIGDPRDRKPARYTASGSADGLLSQSRGPTLAAPADDGFVMRGVVATGTISGSAARYSGTSVAAPQVARRLLDLALAGRLPALAADDWRGWRHEVATLTDGAGPPDPRLGAGIVPPEHPRVPGPF